MNRRRILQSVGSVALAAALPARAQALPVRIAWISPTRPGQGSPFLEAMRQGLRGYGYVEGSNFALQTYWGEDSPEQLEAIVAQAIAANPRVIVAYGPTALRVRAATSTIPVVFGFSGDPIEAGLVETLAHPGRNMTGISFLTLELVGKRIEILREVLPGLRRVAILAAPQHPGDQAERRASQEAASSLGINTAYFEARNGAQLPAAMSAIEKSGSDAVVMFPVQYVIVQGERIAAWAVRNRLPTVSGWAQFAEGGNLLSYGPNLREASARMAYYVDRILKGARPAAIPVELPTKVELVVNLNAARALGVNVPQSVLLRADRVIGV